MSFNSAQFNTVKFNHFAQLQVLEWRLYKHPNTSFETLVQQGNDDGESIDYSVLMPATHYRLVFSHTLLPDDWDIFFTTPSFGIHFDGLGG